MLALPLRRASGSMRPKAKDQAAMPNEVKLLPTLDEVHAFLLGEGPLDGCWFGDDTRPPFTSSRPYWWRKSLRDAITRSTTVVTDEVERLLALLRRVEPHLDAIVCYASTMDEHEPNRIAFDVREALASMPTVVTGEQPGWQPIDTLDVSKLHADDEMLIHNDRGTFVGAWEPDWSIEHGFHGGWWMIGDGKDFERALRGDIPTHWQPLPEPPAQPGDA
jgi:hypothetical protein